MLQVLLELTTWPGALMCTTRKYRDTSIIIPQWYEIIGYPDITCIQHHPAICAQMERERCLLHPHAWPRVIDHNHDMAACRWPLSCAIRRRSYSRDETRDVIRIHTKNEIHERIADRSWKQQLPDGAFIFLPLSHLIYHAVPSASLMADLIWSFRDHSGTSLWWDFPMASDRNVACVPRWQLGTGASDVYNIYIIYKIYIYVYITIYII